MGKTLQTISTILDNRPRLQRCIPGGKYPPCTSEERKDIDIEEKLWAKAKKEWLYEMKMNDVVDSLLPKSSKKGEPEGGARSGTLIVCPLIVILAIMFLLNIFSQDCIVHCSYFQEQLPCSFQCPILRCSG